MDGTKRGRMRSFLLGGLVGASAGIAAARRLRPALGQRRPRPVGLAAFEDAPCFQELIEREAREARERAQ
jgi:gas vesicle protein